MPLPFYNSFLNRAITSGSPECSMGLLAAQLSAKSAADSLLYQTPIFNFDGAGISPMYNSGFDMYLNPMFAAWQVASGWQNNNGFNWQMPFNNMFGNFQFPNWTPWANNNNNVSNNSNNDNDSNSTKKDNAKEVEYETLKELLNKFCDTYGSDKNNSAMQTTVRNIRDAINKSGTTEEKLNALKEVYKKLDKTKISNLVLDTPEYKANLEKAGYRFATTKESQKNIELRKELKVIASELESGKTDSLIVLVKDPYNNDILNIISSWNDTYKDDTNRGIIRLIANKIKTKDDEKELQITGVTNLAMSLINQVEEVKSKVDGNFTNLDAAQKALQTALTNATGNKSSFTKEKVMIVAQKFDELYAQLRLIEAQRIQNNINTKYGDLNVVAKDAIVNATKEDLKKEGIDIATIKVDEVRQEEDEGGGSDIDDEQTPQERIKAHIEAKNLKEYCSHSKKVPGVYATYNASQTGEHPKFYMIEGDDIVELVNVKSMDENKNCTTIDGKPHKLSEITKKPVSSDEIEQYNKTIEKVNKLKSEGKIQFSAYKDTELKKNWPHNIPLYLSKCTQSNGKYQFFVVRDNKLVQISCKNIDRTGMIELENGSKVKYGQLTDDNFVEISESDICTQAQKDGAAIDLSTTGTMDELAEKFDFKATDVTGYYSKNKTFYKYNEDNQTFEKLDGVTEINANGTMKQNGKIVAIRELEDPSESGKMFRKKLYGDTEKENYTVAKRKLNSFKTYDLSEDIISFIEGYNKQKSPVISWNDTFCSQISSEHGSDKGWDDNYKTEALQTIAKQILKVMNELGWSKSDEDYEDMKYYATHKMGEDDDWKRNSWSFWSSNRTGAANHMDDIIEKVIEKYREKNPKA